MTASIAMYDFYFIVQAVVYNKIGWVYLNSYRWAYIFTYYSATLLFEIGAVLTVHKWILFLIRIQTSVKAETVLVELKTALQQDETFDNELEISQKPSVEMLPAFKSEPETISRSQLFKKYNSYLNVVTVVIITFLVPYFYIQMTRYCVSKGVNYAEVQLD